MFKFHLKIVLSIKPRRWNTDNVLSFEIDYTQTNKTSLVPLNANSLCCAWIREREREKTNGALTIILTLYFSVVAQ